MPTLRYFKTKGRIPFREWRLGLVGEAAHVVDRALARLELGNTSNVEPVGEGVHEYKIDWGPGYRLYFGNDGQRTVLLLIGGSKKRQQADIDQAQAYWKEYLARKKR